MPKPTLIFVYNADSGFVNALLDTGHKIVSPQTYACHLCELTHSVFSMRDEWKRFVDGLKLSVEFLHRDELMNQYSIKNAQLPAVFLKTDTGLQEWISREEIINCRSLDDLTCLIDNRSRIFD
ncbi:MAG: hypothetical protein HY081_10100 [Gammaproteobacteria bacterium]|nr:hypothetical protein [Gammaproteobacteria bacterium]